MTREEISSLAEIVHNGEPINWVYWAQLPNIEPSQAAKLAHHIDPKSWPKEDKWTEKEKKEYSEVKLLLQKIDRLEQWLDGYAQLWTLSDLVTALGDDVAPFGMVQAVKAKQQTEAADDTGTGSHAGAEPKPKGRNQKRMDILNEWYRALCLKHQNNIEAINQEINSLTNESIKRELASITLANEKHLWANGADRWIMDNGESVWRFKRTQGGKPTKS